MAVFAVTYVYGPDTEKRMGIRPAHRDVLARLHSEGRLLASGPLEDELTPGALLIFEAESKAAVTDILAQDPFKDAGVIAETSIREWNMVFGSFAP